MAHLAFCTFINLNYCCSTQVHFNVLTPSDSHNAIVLYLSEQPRTARRAVLSSIQCSQVQQATPPAKISHNVTSL